MKRRFWKGIPVIIQEHDTEIDEKQGCFYDHSKPHNSISKVNKIGPIKDGQEIKRFIEKSG